MVIFKFDSRFLLTQVRWIQEISWTPTENYQQLLSRWVSLYKWWDMFVDSSLSHSESMIIQHVHAHKYHYTHMTYTYIYIYIWVVFSNIQRHKTIYSVYVHISTLFTLCSILVLYAQFQYRKQTNKQTTKLTNKQTNKALVTPLFIRAKQESFLPLC